MNRQEAEELLPWYVAGALSAREAQAVEAFIDSGAISRSTLDEVRSYAAATAETGPDEPDYDPQILQRVLTRLDDVPQMAPEEPVVVVPERTAHQEGTGRGGWLGALVERLQWRLTPPLARALIAAQLLLVLGLAAALVLQAPSIDREYETVSATPAATQAGSYTLQFAPGTTEADLRRLLVDADATIVSGPSALGLYTIAFAPDADADAGAARLRGSSLVSYLQPLPPG
ncbi:MAG: hypothetical protein R3E86_12345 [Pseudomonadales bacterium]